MRAIVRDRYGAEPYLTDIPAPRPGDGEVLVRVVASSLNTADLDIMAGRPRAARIGNGLGRPRNPRLGLDVAGVVEAMGPGVTGFAVGDEVWGDVFGHYGAFAELVTAPARVFSPKRAAVPFEDAACMPHSAALALQALNAKGGVRNGDRVLINGGGGCVGPFAIQIAKARGAEVVAVDHGGKFDLMKRAGADHLVDYTTTDCTRIDDRFDFIVDIAANRNLLAYRRVLSLGGHFVLVARDLGGFAAALVLGGRRMGNLTWGPSRSSDLAELGRLLASGAVTPIIDRVCSLDEVPAELRRAQAGTARGKVVVKTRL
jgi:NADPH:quinone reductase-like Zn-dependent oxidoreductase